MAAAFLVIDTTYKRCHKRGHRSKGAAEAHLRGLMRAQSFKPDQKADLQLGVYYCIAKRCQANPWHVGHRRDTRAEA